MNKSVTHNEIFFSNYDLSRLKNRIPNKDDLFYWNLFRKNGVNKKSLDTAVNYAKKQLNSTRPQHDQ